MTINQTHPNIEGGLPDSTIPQSTCPEVLDVDPRVHRAGRLLPTMCKFEDAKLPDKSAVLQNVPEPDQSIIATPTTTASTIPVISRRPRCSKAPKKGLLAPAGVADDLEPFPPLTLPAAAVALAGTDGGP